MSVAFQRIANHRIATLGSTTATSGIYNIKRSHPTSLYVVAEVDAFAPASQEQLTENICLVLIHNPQLLYFRSSKRPRGAIFIVFAFFFSNRSRKIFSVFCIDFFLNCIYDFIIMTSQQFHEMIRKKHYFFGFEKTDQIDQFSVELALNKNFQHLK